MPAPPSARFVTILYYLSLLLVGSLLLACSDEKPKDRTAVVSDRHANEPDDAVARVGDEFITFSQLNSMLNSSAVVGMQIPELGTPERSEALIALLDNAISANLVYLDAKSKGIDRLSAYKEDVNRFEGTLLASMYRDLLMQGEIQVSDIEVLHHYNTMTSKGGELDDETRLAIEALIRRKKLDAFEVTLRDRIRENVDVVVNNDILSANHDNKRSDTDVVATYDSHRITWSQIKELMLNASRSPEQPNMYISDDKERRLRLEQHLDSTIMALKGRAAGLENDPVYIERTNEYRKARLINEHRNGLMHSWNPSEERLEAYFDEHRDMFTIPETRRVQIVSVASREEAESILTQINNGELSLAQAAMQYSTDPQAKHTQGHIGWITRDMVLGGPEDVIFKLQLDAISEPVESESGWHLIKVVQIVEPRLENLGNAQTRQRAFRAYMQDRFDDYVVDLRRNDFDVVVYRDELQRQFRREAELVAGLKARQEGPATGQRVEDLHKYITLPAQQQ